MIEQKVPAANAGDSSQQSLSRNWRRHSVWPHLTMQGKKNNVWQGTSSSRPCFDSSFHQLALGNVFHLWEQSLYQTILSFSISYHTVSTLYIMDFLIGWVWNLVHSIPRKLEGSFCEKQSKLPLSIALISEKSWCLLFRGILEATLDFTRPCSLLRAGEPPCLKINSFAQLWQKTLYAWQSIINVLVCMYQLIMTLVSI